MVFICSLYSLVLLIIDLFWPLHVCGLPLCLGCSPFFVGHFVLHLSFLLKKGVLGSNYYFHSLSIEANTFICCLSKIVTKALTFFSLFFLSFSFFVCVCEREREREKEREERGGGFGNRSTWREQ